MLTKRKQISCSSYQNFASTQPRDAYPAQPPKGAMVSNNIHVASLLNSPNNLEPNSTPITLLPDLKTQISSFIALPPPETPAKETLFIISFGYWDIYNFASLDYALAKSTTDESINELFAQLDILYAHYNSSLVSSSTTPTNTSAHTFQIIIPKVLDPSVSPGWLSQRPSPVKPSSVAEQQKNAAYLTERWNQGVENKLGPWMRSPDEIEAAEATKTTAKEAAIAAAIAKSKPKPKASTTTLPLQSTPTSTSNKTVKAELLKDVFYYDLSAHLLDTMIEHHMESEGLTDASGLGAGDNPYETVERPCVYQADDDEDIYGLGELGNGMAVCAEPDMWLWWDAWGIGSRAQKMVGKEVAVLVGSGGSERVRLAKVASNGKGGGFWSGKVGGAV